MTLFPLSMSCKAYDTECTARLFLQFATSKACLLPMLLLDGSRPLTIQQHMACCSVERDCLTSHILVRLNRSV